MLEDFNIYIIPLYFSFFTIKLNNLFQIKLTVLLKNLNLQINYYIFIVKKFFNLKL